MSETLDVATHLIYISGGRLLPEDPPGYAMLPPPRKAARGREKDYLFLCLSLRAREAVPDERYAALLDLAATTFYGSPGSVTSALRQAISAVNQQLLEANLNAGQAQSGLPMQGGLLAAAIRGADFYAVQGGPGLLLVARPAGHERFPTTPTRPLGLSNTFETLYFHTAIAEGDYFCLSHSPGHGWSDIALVGLGNLTTLTAVAERLCESAASDTSALVGRFEFGSASVPLPAAHPRPGPSVAATPAAASATAPTALPGETPAARREQPARRPAAPGAPAPRGAGLAEFFRLRRRPQPGVEAEPANGSPADDESAAPTVTWGGASPARSEEALAFQAEREPNTLAAAPRAQRPAVDLPPFLRAAHGATATHQTQPAGAGLGEAPEPAPFQRTEPADRPNPLASAGAAIKRTLRSLGRAVGVTLAELIRVVRMLLARMLPEGMLQKEGLFAVPTSVQISIALIIPVIVAGTSVWLYLENGRAEQYSIALTEAQWEVGRGRVVADAQSARPHWEAALTWLSTAEALRPGQPEVAALRSEAQARLDELDWVTRLDYQPLLLGGFGRDARLKRILLAGQDVYALEETRNRVYRVTPAANGGYTLDEDFQCAGSQTVRNVTVGQIVDIALIAGSATIAGDASLAPGSTVVLAFDSLGALLYCAPGVEQPYASYLAAPDTGWIRPASLELYADRLYVLDPGASEIWQYQSSNGAFTQAPTRYFTSVAYDFADVTDFAIAGGEVFLLRRDGRIAHCSRLGPGVPATCAEVVHYTDARPGQVNGERLAGVTAPLALSYDPPPEPSLYLLDGENSAVYQLSQKLALVQQFRPYFPLAGPITSVAIDPAKRFYVAAGDNIYVAARP